MRLSQLVFKYTANVSEIHRISCGIDDAVVVVGDPENAAYEWVIERIGVGVLEHSDDAFGSPESALRAGLNKYLE